MVGTPNIGVGAPSPPKKAGKLPATSWAQLGNDPHFFLADYQEIANKMMQQMQYLMQTYV